MKILAILIFLVNGISINCNENVFANFKDKNVLMEQVENSPQEVFYVQPQESDYEHKIRTKKYTTEPVGRMQYMIIKKTENVPESRKYSGAHSMAEQITYHNKHPSKFTYSISHKTKARPVKIVRNGPVKHIYVNIPQYVMKPQQFVNNHEVESHASSNNYYQQNFGQHENYYTPSPSPSPSVQNMFVSTEVKPNALSEINKDTSSQGLNIVSSGYSIQDTNNQNQNYGQEYSNTMNSNEYGKHNYNFGVNSGPQTFNNPDYSASSSQITSQFEFSQPQFPQYSSDGKEQYSYEIPDEYKSLFSNNDFSSSSQFDQPQQATQQDVQSIPYQENYNFGKMRRISEISGFEPDLINMVNAVINREHETPGNINSNEKPVHMLHG